MKIYFLFSIPVVATAVTTRSATAVHLMNAVGHRNVTTMEALVQELADESVNEPGWKFDDDVKAALTAIREMFVKSIQSSLQDQHKADQEHMNCFTQDCFGDCERDYESGSGQCEKIGKRCDDLKTTHADCRADVKEKYAKMAQACAKLHCFDPREIQGIDDKLYACPTDPEDCLCPDLTFCHTCDDEGNDGKCKKPAFGNWLKNRLERYRSKYDEWDKVYKSCKTSYHAFLKADMHCDADQKAFEKCKCDKNRCEHIFCAVDFEQCTEQCWARYDELVSEKECLEKDRKIDWSATKKIECYVNVLLHDYTKEELKSKCGTGDCVNVAREADYKHCATVCRNIDHDGHWPTVLSVEPGNLKIEGHEPREKLSKADKSKEYHLGDGEYKCDINGAKVFTKHRGGVSREDEDRCTEHLDIDYQIPECAQPDCSEDPICDAAFHEKYYGEFDDTSPLQVNLSDTGSDTGSLILIGDIDYCEKEGSDCDEHCFNSVTLKRGEVLGNLVVEEHTVAWAFNRCECSECSKGGYPEYPHRPEGHTCGHGAHTRGWTPVDVDKALVIETKQEMLDAGWKWEGCETGHDDHGGSSLQKGIWCHSGAQMHLQVPLSGGPSECTATWQNDFGRTGADGFVRLMKNGVQLGEARAHQEKTVTFTYAEGDKIEFWEGFAKMKTKKDWLQCSSPWKKYKKFNVPVPKKKVKTFKPVTWNAFSQTRVDGEGGLRFTGHSWRNTWAETVSTHTAVKFKFTTDSQAEQIIGFSCQPGLSDADWIYSQDVAAFFLYRHLGAQDLYRKELDSSRGYFKITGSGGEVTSFDWAEDVWSISINSEGFVEFAQNDKVFATSKHKPSHPCVVHAAGRPASAGNIIYAEADAPSPAKTFEEYPGVSDKLEILDYIAFEHFGPKTYQHVSGVPGPWFWKQEHYITGINFHRGGDGVVLKDTEKRKFGNLEWYYTYDSQRACSVDVYGSNNEEAGLGDDAHWTKVATADMDGRQQGPTKMSQVNLLADASTPFQYWKVMWTKNGAGGHGPLAGWWKLEPPLPTTHL